jgi:hypothetical protein
MTRQAQTARQLIAANVRAELRRRGLTIKDLSGLNNLSFSYWQRRTSGDLAFEIDELIVLADFINGPLVTLLQVVAPEAGTRGKPLTVLPPDRLHATNYRLAA